MKPEFTYNAFDYDCGLKLMEHSYKRNFLCLAVMYGILDAPKRLVWAGDYADGEDGKENTPNLYQLANDPTCKEISPSIIPAHDVLKEIFNEYFCVINHTKEIYFEWSTPNKKFTINPLPLLTAEGNGRGGGDYFGTNEDIVGTWARDMIEISSQVPADYTQIDEPTFEEN